MNSLTTCASDAPILAACPPKKEAALRQEDGNEQAITTLPAADQIAIHVRPEAVDLILSPACPPACARDVQNIIESVVAAERLPLLVEQAAARPEVLAELRQSGMIEDPDADGEHLDTGGMVAPLYMDPADEIALADMLASNLKRLHLGRHVGEWGRWLAYDSSTGTWSEDHGHQSLRWGRGMVRAWLAAVKEEIRRAKSKEERKIADNRVKRISCYQNLRACRAALDLAASHEGIGVSPADLDADPYTLACANGLLDLRTCTLRPHDPAALVTKSCRAAYDPTAEAPHWTLFIEQVLPDIEVRQFLQRWLGQSLLGEVKEHTLLVCWGSGANGKSTALNAIQHAMGTYSVVAPVSLLIGDDHGHPTDRATLHRKRLAVASESGEGNKLREDQLKMLTGGDVITCRKMHQDFWEYEPTHSLVLCTNHKPQVRGQDHGLWRRLKLVPWTVTVPTERQDHDLPAKLEAEANGILLWLIEGWRAYQQVGLAEPAAVLAATASYRADEDPLGEWLDACCELGEDCTVSKSLLYDSYSRWCDRVGIQKPLGQRTVSRMCGERDGITAYRSTANRGECRFRGIRLIGTP